MREIKFYGKDDLSVGWNLIKIEEIYNEFSEDKYFTLNQILELHNCTIYIDNKLYLKKWDDNYILYLNEVNRSVKNRIAQYFIEFDERNIIDELKDMQFDYQEDFLELFFRFRLDQRVPENVVSYWIDEEIFDVYTVCHNKQFVRTYNDITGNLLLKYSSNAEVIIEKYLMDRSNEKEIYLPNVDNDTLVKLINKYIDSSDVNANNLELLMNAGRSSGFNFTPEIKLKARKRLETRRINLVNLNSEERGFERIFGVTGKFDYKTNSIFKMKEIFSQLKLNGYYDLLLNNDVELERVLEWYFNVYVKNEFKIDNYRVELPSKYATYREKCLALFSEMEYVLVQFETFVRKKYIDQELISVNSNGILFSQISSLIDDKYFYPTEKLKNILFYLFSDQSRLCYINDNLKGKNFVELVAHHKIKLEDMNVV